VTRLSCSPQIFGKVACRVHQDAGYRRLQVKTQLLWLTLLSMEEAQSGPPGLMHVSDFTVLDNLSHHTLEELRECKAELQAAGMLRCDERLRIWWRVKSVRADYNSPANFNVSISWARKLATFDRCQVMVDYCAAIIAESQKWDALCRSWFLWTLKSVGIDPAEFNAAAPAEAPPKKGSERVLPFRAKAALEFIAAESAGRFLATNPGRQAIEIERVIKVHPTRADWEEVGRHLAAGGESYADVLDSRWVTRRNFDAALARARARSEANLAFSDGYQDE
jgi:hypothetical protein